MSRERSLKVSSLVNLFCRQHDRAGTVVRHEVSSIKQVLYLQVIAFIEVSDIQQ